MHHPVLPDMDAEPVSRILRLEAEVVIGQMGALMKVNHPQDIALTLLATDNILETCRI